MSNDSFADAERLIRTSADSLVMIERDKVAAAKQALGKDVSAENAAKAKREGWTHTPGPTYAPTRR